MIPLITLKRLLLLSSLIGCLLATVAAGEETAAAAVEGQQGQAVTAPNAASADGQQQQQSEGAVPLTLAAEQDNAKLPNGGNESEPSDSAGGGRAFAAPLLRGQQQSENAVEVNGERKTFFKIHYRDGVQKAIFDETQQRVPADFEDTNSVAGGGQFDEYDDSRLVDPKLEQPLFIPEIYRNETRDNTAAPPPKSGGTSKGGGTNRPLVAPELQSRQPVTIRTTTARPGAVTVRPTQPFVRPPASPDISLQRPRLPPPGPPPQPSRPVPETNVLPQQSLRPNAQTPAAQSRPPNVGSRPTPNQQQQRPFVPNVGVGQIRSGVCHQAIFYTPQTVTELDIHRIYTHFAVVVSVDQCARTCHEFNCDVAILDPISRHCQFNPSTAFRLHPACPQWPNPLYRNNVRHGQDPVRIACVTCQQRKRIPRPGQSSPMPFNGQGRQQQQTIASRQTVPRPAVGAAPPPAHVIRTTVRDRLNAGPATHNAENGPLRIANAAAVLKATGGSDESATGRDLSAEFHKLERLLKSSEDYLDETEPQGAKQLVKDEGGHRAGPNVGREVPSWREGHPQGDGFSPLRINPLRRPYMDDPSRPHAIFYSTDKMFRQKVVDTERKVENSREEFYQRRRRGHRNADGEEQKQPREGGHSE